MESKKEILSAFFDNYRNELKDLNEYLCREIGRASCRERV